MAFDGSPRVTFTRERFEPYMDPCDARALSGRFPPNISLPAGTVVGEITAQPGFFNAYNAGNADGTQVARGLLEYSVETDADGCIINRLGVFPDHQHNSPVWFKGIFHTSRIPAGSLDTNAVDQMGGRLIQGTTANGILSIN